MMTDKIKFALQFLPIPFIYFMYTSGYNILYSAKPTTAEWYASGSILLMGGVTALCFYAELMSLVPMALIAISLLLCGGYSSFQFVLHLKKHLVYIANKKGAWTALKWMTTLPWIKALILYLGPIVLGVLCVRLIISHSKSSNWLPSIRKKERRTTTKFGSAEFLPYKEVKKLSSQKGLPVGFAVNLPDDELKTIKETVKKTKQRRRELVRIESEHALLIAPPGAGKGVGFILPMLMDYDGPVFVCDPKHGENYAIAKRRRKAMGRKVVLLDPFDIHQGQGRTINIIDIVRSSDDTRAIEASAEFAKLICPVINDSGKESHFDKFGASVIQCMILYVALSKDVPNNKRNIFTVYDFICSTKEELYGPDGEPKRGNNSASVAEDAPDSKVVGLLHSIVNEKTIAAGRASRIASKALGADYRESSGYFSTAYRELEFVDTPVMQEHMSYSDFDMRDILKGDTDVFVAMPSEKIKIYPNYMRVMIGFALLCIQRAGGYKGEKKIKLILDEFAAFGHISSIADNLVLLRSYGLSIFGVVQNLELLKKAYPDDMQSFLSSSLSIFVAPEDPETCAFISKKIGPKTIVVGSENIGAGTSKKALSLLKDSSSAQEGINLSETSRQLLMEDEVRRLGDTISLVFIAGEAPMILKKINYFSYAPWKGMFDPNPFRVPGFKDETDLAIKDRESRMSKKHKPRTPIVDVDEKISDSDKSLPSIDSEKLADEAAMQEEQGVEPESTSEDGPGEQEVQQPNSDDAKKECHAEAQEAMPEETNEEMWSQIEEVG